MWTVKSRKKRSWLGNLLFVLPFALILGLLIYGYLHTASPGKVDIQAVSENKYLPAGQTSSPLSVQVTVNGLMETTPYIGSLPTGTYTVSYATIPWYQTPAPKNVSVGNGLTVDATGTYTVIPVFIQVNGSGFNTTSVSAEHGVTPVIWMNPTSSDILIGVAPYGKELLGPGQNFTTIFQSPGAYEFTSSVGNPFSSSGTVKVQ